MNKVTPVGEVVTVEEKFVLADMGMVEILPENKPLIVVNGGSNEVCNNIIRRKH